MSDGVRDQRIEVEAFQGRPPVRIRLDAVAPFGWWPAICIALVALIDRVEANLLAGALPQIQREFGFGDGAAGAIASGAAVASVVLLIPAGRLADTRRRTWTVAVVVAIWSALTLGTGLATSYAMLFAMRLLLGSAGQLYNPPASSLLGDLYPGSSRARAFGIERFAYFAGLPIGVLAGGALAGMFGWRGMFLVAAVPGVVIAVLVLTLREPVRGLADHVERLRAAKTEPAGPARGTVTTPITRQLRDLWGIATLRTIVTGLTILFFGLGGLYFWMPSFYERAHDLPEGLGAAMAGGMGLIGQIIGVVYGSRLGDRWHRIRPSWRITVGFWGLAFGTASLVLATVVPVLGVHLTGFLLSNVGFCIALPNLTAANADVVAAERRGMGFAVLQFLITLGGAAGPLLVGVVSDATGSLTAALILLLLPLSVGCFVVRRGRATFDADADRALNG